MAEAQVSGLQSAIMKLSLELTCPICLEWYKQPKVLPCLHSFCLKCLKGIQVIRDDEFESRPHLYCPKCREVAILPSEGVDGFKSAFYIEPLSDLRQSLTSSEDKVSKVSSLCEKCFKKSSLVASCAVCKLYKCPECQCSKTDCTSPCVSGDSHCQFHPDRSLEFYCHSCELMLCCACIVEDHKLHDFKLLSECIAEQKRKLSGVLESFENQQKRLQEAVDEADRGMAKSRAQQFMLQEKIKHYFVEIHELVDQREKELLCELSEKMNTQLSVLENQKSCGLFALGQISKHRMAILDNLETKEGNAAENFSLRKFLNMSMLSAHKEMDCEIALNGTSLVSDICFSEGNRTEDSVSNLGKVYEKCPSAKTSSASGRGLEFATVGRKSKVYLKSETNMAEVLKTVLLLISIRYLVRCALKQISNIQ